MRYVEIINEAPIADLATSPIQDQNPKRWHKADPALLKNPKAIAKVYRMFERTPFVFNFYLIMQREGINGIGLSSLDVKKQLEDIMQKPIDTDGKITIVYTLNGVGQAKRDMPLSAWTFAHRIIHTIQATNDKKFNHFEEIFWSNAVNLALLTTNIPARFTGSILSLAEPENSMVSFVAALMTQKSARDNNISIGLDVGGEALAQYLLTGRVRLRRAKDFLPLLTQRLYDHRRASRWTVNEKIDYDALDIRIAQMEDSCNRAAETILKNMVGNILSF